MNRESNIIEIKNIFRDKIILHVPLKYMMSAIKVEVCNLFFHKVTVDLYEIIIEGLIPGKIYKNLYLKIYHTDSEFLKLFIDKFKTEDGNKNQKMIVNFYRKFMGNEIGEGKFNYWNNKINSGEKTLEQFLNYVLRVNKFSIGKLNDMEFLNCIYEMLINNFENDLLYFWLFHFEFKTKGLSQIERRKEIFKSMFREYEIGITEKELLCN